MLLKIFKSNQRIMGVIVVIFSIVLWVPGYFKQLYLSTDSELLFSNFYHYLFSIQWLNILFTSLLIGFQALFLNYFINNQKLIKVNSYLVAFFYVLLNGANYYLFSFNAVVFSNTFLLLGLYQLFKLYNLTSATSILFNAGLLFGLSVIIYPPYIILFILVWIGLSYLRTPKLNDYIVALVGLLIPFIYWVSYQFIQDEITIVTLNVFFAEHLLKPDIDLVSNNYFFYLLAFFILLALFNTIGFLNRSVVKIRKLLVIVLLLAAISFLILLLNNNDLMGLYLLLIIPFSVLLANFVSNIKKSWQGELMIILLVGVIIISYFL